jgi:hypothetical protein
MSELVSFSLSLSVLLFDKSAAGVIEEVDSIRTSSQGSKKRGEERAGVVDASKVLFFVRNIITNV